MKTILWFREDLRVFDNPALNFAASSGEVLPVFIYPEGLGGASYWWLHHSLAALQKSLSELGISLVLRTGDPSLVLKEIVQEVGADQAVWNRVYSPNGIQQGTKVKDTLQLEGIECQSFNGQLLIEPTKVLNKQAAPYKVFTPFWRYCYSQLETVWQPQLSTAISKLNGCGTEIASEKLEDWSLLPCKPDWSQGLVERWQPGEDGAQQRWSHFLQNSIGEYKEGRDFPRNNFTSYLSPHLAFGEISPQQIWCDTQQALANGEVDEINANKFLAEIGWREFSRYLLVHFPHITKQSFNPKFDDFPWQENPDLVSAWQQGKTGYPIVDAGMRELWHTGYMHNRVRMVVASFLTKHCLTHWEVGMNWFWDTLVDADIANNTASWQWASGCGADAAPYFRIFNPILQGERFDKAGDYVKQWVPELSELPSKYLHKPWEADPMTLQLAGVELGANYPHPVVDHKEARGMALSAYQAIKSSQ